MRVYIVWVKNLVKQINFLPNRWFRGYFVWWPLFWNTREIHYLAWLFSFHSCASHVAFLRVASCELLANSTDSSFEIWFFTNLSHSSLTNKPTYIQGKWLKKITIKFDTKLKPIQNSWKLQLCWKIHVYIAYKTYAVGKLTDLLYSQFITCTM